MPPEPLIFLSGDAHRPCRDTDSGATAGVPSVPCEGSAGAGPHASAPAGLPTIELHRRLVRVHDWYTGLVGFYPDLIWGRQPDPIRACQILMELRDQLQGLHEAIADAHRHVELLFDLSLNESERRQRR